MKPAQATAMAVGVWLMSAPALLGYAADPAADLHRIVGPLAASIGLIAVWDATRGLSQLLLVLGPVLLAGSFLIGDSIAGAFNGLFCGVLFVVAAHHSGVSGPLGGGWAALLAHRRSH